MKYKPHKRWGLGQPKKGEKDQVEMQQVPWSHRWRGMHFQQWSTHNFRMYFMQFYKYHWSQCSYTIRSFHGKYMQWSYIGQSFEILWKQYPAFWQLSDSTIRYWCDECWDTHHINPWWWRQDTVSETLHCG